jgi:transposase-like protein
MASVLSAPHFHNEEAAYVFVEARIWPEGPHCPHCGCTAEKIGELKGKSTRIGVRKCYGCRKPFTVKVGTIFEASHVPLHIWLQAIHLICSSKKGISTNQLKRTLGVAMKTAWFLGHRIREAMREDRGIFAPPLGGTGKMVEADEAYIGRDGAKKLKGPGEKQPVISLVERDGMVRSFHVANLRAESLRPIIDKHIARASRLMTDESNIYAGIGWNFAQHGTVMHSAKEFVRGDIHTNTVEGYFSILKRGITGVYHHVSEAHLRRYLVEFDFRYNNRMGLGVNDEMRAERALKGVIGKRLTYETTRVGRSAENRAS